MARAASSATRKVVDLGFLPEEARHGFLINVPKGDMGSDVITITEYGEMISVVWAIGKGRGAHYTRK